jgi:hypothetical protein
MRPMRASKMRFDASVVATAVLAGGCGVAGAAETAAGPEQQAVPQEPAAAEQPATPEQQAAAEKLGLPVAITNSIGMQFAPGFRPGNS